MQIRPYPKNAKRHPKDQIEKLSRAIERFGFSPAIEVDAEGVIVSGHGRWMAATENLGWTDIAWGSARSPVSDKRIPVIVLSDLTDDEITAKRLADNKLAETDVDMILAIEDLKGLQLNGFDPELTGYSLDLLIDPADDEDTVPEAPIVPQSQKGDIYVLGEHVIMCGDSTDHEDVGRLMNGHKADMVFTDPPYNVNYSGSGKKTANGIMNDNMSANDFDTFLWEVFKRYNEITKHSAALYVFHSNKTQSQFEKALDDSGFDVKAQIIWNKPSAGLGMNEYRSKHEPMFYCSFKDSKPAFYGDRTGTTVWDFHKDESALLKWAKNEKRLEHEGKTTVWTMKREPVAGYEHPTQKPVELITKAIVNSSKRDEIVLDLFAGSGATLIACEKTGRKCYTMELDPRYVDVVVSRYCTFTENSEIIKNGKTILWAK